MTGPVTVITPREGWSLPDWGELRDYRELLAFFVWRDLKVRYKQTLLGAAWAVLQPLLTMAAFSLFLGRIPGLRIEGIPYAMTTFCALVPWTYFANVLSSASLSVAEHRSVITKVYFPRLLLPLTPAVSGLVDFALSLALLVAMLPAFGLPLRATLIWTPLLTALAGLTALSVSLWLSALNALFRDVRYVIPLLVQCWMFVTPVVYPIRLVPAAWRTLYALNPMTGIVEAFRWSVLGVGEPPWTLLTLSVAAVLALLAGGLLFFGRMERRVIDAV